MAQRLRKIRKKRGSRTCGGGSHKKNRGAGGHGGKGMAGGFKSKWTWVIKFDPDRFGRHGFKIPSAIKDVYDSINVGYLDEIAGALVEKKLAKKGKNGVSIDVADLGVEKVLGRGKVTQPLIITAKRFSASAAKKIEENGGKVVQPE